MLEVAAVADIPIAPQAFDRESFMNRINNDGQFAREIIETYLEDMPVQLETLAQAIEEGDAEKAANLAHRIKGASANISCEVLREAAGIMETAGRAGDMDGARELFPDLLKKFADIRETLKKLKFIPKVNS